MNTLTSAPFFFFFFLCSSFLPIPIPIPILLANAHRTLLSNENPVISQTLGELPSADVWSQVRLFLSEQDANKLSQTSVFLRESIAGHEEKLIFAPLRRVFAHITGTDRSLTHLHERGAWGMDASHGPCHVWIAPFKAYVGSKLAEMPRAPISVCLVNPGYDNLPREGEEAFERTLRDETILLRGLDLGSGVSFQWLSAEQRRWLLRPSVRWLRLVADVPPRVHTIGPSDEEMREEREAARMLTQELPERCPKLEELVLSGEYLDDELLKGTGPFNLQDMTSLRRLELHDVDCSSVVDLQRLPDHLQELQVRGGNCAVDFCRFPSQLRAVQVRFTRGAVSGDCVFSEARWPHLQEVVIEGVTKEEIGEPWDPSWNQVVKRPDMMERAEAVAQ